jgi:predicted DCC family thiol-disulfide oxidoreductase YuxK
MCIICQAAIFEIASKATTTPVAPAVSRVFAFLMQAEQSIAVDQKSPGGSDSPQGLILFDGVCVLCSRGCHFVSKRDRRGYFRFVPIQLAEGRPLADQLGIDPDRPDSFAFVANGQGYVKSEAVLRIARELPRWRWTWVFHFIPRVIRDAIYDLVARNRYRWFGRRDACILPNSDRSWPS